LILYRKVTGSSDPAGNTEMKKSTLRMPLVPGDTFAQIENLFCFQNNGIGFVMRNTRAEAETDKRSSCNYSIPF
jgi:hypothetical protein